MDLLVTITGKVCKKVTITLQTLADVVKVDFAITCASHLIDRVAFKRQSTIFSEVNFVLKNACASKAET